MKGEPEILPYVKLVLIRELKKEGWPEGFHRRDEFEAALRAMTVPGLEKFDPQVSTEALETALRQILDEMISEQVLVAKSDVFAGEYFQVRPTHVDRYRDTNWANNSLSETANAVGAERFFADVFAGFRSGLRTAPPEAEISDSVDADEMQLTDALEAELIPASDRMVPLDHNSAPYRDVAQGLQELQEELRSANDLDCDPEERDRLLVSLTAARKLWEAVQLKVMQIKVGIIITVQDTIDLLEKVGKAVGRAVLIDTIKSIVKHKTGIDL